MGSQEKKKRSKLSSTSSSSSCSSQSTRANNSTSTGSTSSCSSSTDNSTSSDSESSLSQISEKSVITRNDSSTKTNSNSPSKRSGVSTDKNSTGEVLGVHPHSGLDTGLDLNGKGKNKYFSNDEVPESTSSDIGKNRKHVKRSPDQIQNFNSKSSRTKSVLYSEYESNDKASKRSSRSDPLHQKNFVSNSEPSRLNHNGKTSTKCTSARNKILSPDEIKTCRTQVFISEESELTKHNFPCANKLQKSLCEFNDISDVSLKERRCPVPECNSLGHLSGRYDKHFTKEACPMYHNLTINDCKEAYIKRHANEEKHEVNNTHNNVQKSMQTTQEHQSSKFNNKELRIVLEDCNKVELQADKQDCTESSGVYREPDLLGVVPEHHLRLFREAQAIASENIDQDVPYVTGSRSCTKFIEMGMFKIQVWYESPYPEEYSTVAKLYICEYCLHYMKNGTTNRRHAVKCVWRHPPGAEIYRNHSISVWEVDGKLYKQYCQKLCLLARFFLDHKTLHDNVEPFFFYVMTKNDSNGCHTVGYFSKEKYSSMNYNVSCILTFPHYQRQGYGRLLIDFSYLLTREEGKIGTPEKPLSDLGLISYRSYWKDVLLHYLDTFNGQELCIKDISQETGINSYDIVSTLQGIGMIKYWKGKHIILKKQSMIDDFVQRVNKRGSSFKKLDPTCLKWTPRT